MLLIVDEIVQAITKKSCDISLIANKKTALNVIQKIQKSIFKILKMGTPIMIFIKLIGII